MSRIDHCLMERMIIKVISVVEHNGRHPAGACATAQDAKISLEVTFAAHPEASKSELWDRARDEVLRYLDPA